MAAVSSSSYVPSTAVPQPVAAAVAAAAPENAEPKAAHLIKKLSVDLLKTYNTINQRYYARRKAAPKQRKSPKEDVPGPYDDEHSDYKVRTGERLQDRYVVDCVIGKGSFGRVVKAYDERNSDYVAIKIVKSKRAFRKQAAIEIDILDTLRSGDPTDQYNIVKVKDFFMHHNHQCIVFELLSYNLYELLRDTKFHGVSLNLVRKFAKQLLHTLDYTSKLKGGIIHCDLKPENILLRNSRHSAIKVIDFGSACYSDKKMYTYIQSRFYRAPEVLLGCSYNCAIDMWSLGCILVEMHTGKPIFDGSNAQEQVTQHFEVLGCPPSHMLQTGRKAAEYFMQGSDGGWRIRKTPDPSRIAGSRRTLRHILGVDTHGPRGMRSGEKTGHTQSDYVRFEDLVARMLTYDPKLRITPANALLHPFFQIDDPVAVPAQIAPTPSAVPAPVPSAVPTGAQSLTSPSAAQAAANFGYPAPQQQVAKAYPGTGAPNAKVIDLTRDDGATRRSGSKLSGPTLAGGSAQAAQSKPQAMLSPTASSRPVAMDSDTDPHLLRASRSDLKVAGGDADTAMASADGAHSWNPGNYGLYGGGQKPMASVPQPQQSPLTRTKQPLATGPLSMPGLGRSASDVPQQLYASQHMASGINYAT